MAVDSGLTLATGLLSDARGTYLNLRRSADARVGMLVDLGKTSTQRAEKRAHFRPAGHTKYAPYGAPMEYQGFDAEQFETTNYEYKGGVQWLQADREDDNTGSLTEQAQNMGRSLAIKPEQFLFDAINGTTSWLPHSVSMPDGLDPFTSSTRHERSGGNIISGTTLTTVAGVEAAVYSAENAFTQYKDDYGEPLLADDVLESPTLVVYSSVNNQPFRTAFNAPIVQGSSAGVSNVLVTQVAGKQYVLWETSRLATGVAVVAKTGGPKPFFLQTRTGIEEHMKTAENSDEAEKTGYERVSWKQRLGFGGLATFTAIKLTA